LQKADTGYLVKEKFVCCLQLKSKGDFWSLNSASKRSTNGIIHFVYYSFKVLNYGWKNDLKEIFLFCKKTKTLR